MTHFPTVRAILGALTLLALQPIAPPAHAVGGNGGQAFTLQCTATERLAAVMTHAGRRLEGIGIACVNQAGQWRQVWAGTSSGGSSANFRTINIAPARWVRRTNISIGKCGKSTTRVCGVGFVFDNDFAIDVGTRTGDTRLQAAPGNSELFGFRGRAGTEIDNLDALYRPRQRPAFNNSRQLDGQDFADIVDAALLSGFEMRLNNIGARQGNSWFVERGSYVTMAAVQSRFDIPEWSFRRSRGIYRYFYYVNDVNARSAGIDFDAGRGAFVLRILLEDGGREMKGKCRRKRPNGSYTACGGANEGDGKAPDVQWSFPEIEMLLVPQVVARNNGRNGVGLRVENVRLMGDFSLNGLCSRLAGRCHTILRDWKGNLITGIEAGVMAQINGPVIQRVMADNTRRALNAANIPNLVDVVIDGDSIELRW
ncbi:MAG: hypothetical protein AAFY38_00830 [Pseudomonadota bacterium]